MNYQEYIQSAAWIGRREQAKKRAGHRCQLCSTTDGLVVHHNTYARLGDEDDADLVVLCEGCHTVFHEQRRLVKGPSPQATGRTGRPRGEDPPTLDGEVLDALLDNIPEFKRTWLHTRSPDWSMAQYDLRLCSLAAQVGLADEQLHGLINLHRRTWDGADDAGRDLDYVEATTAKAREGLVHR